MTADNLDQRLVGRRFQLTATDLAVGATFYGILYRLNSSDDLYVGATVIVVQADQHGLTVQVV